MTAQMVTLGDLYLIGSSKRVLKSQWKTEGVPFYRGREITRLAADGFVENELFISEEHFAELAGRSGVPKPGDIVITAIGTIGNAHIVREGDRFYFKDASVLWMKRKTDVSSKFIHLWLQSPLFFEQLDKDNGATVDTLTIQKLQSVRLCVPPLPEQQRIVAILDEAFETIAAARANAEQNRQNARALFESYLQSVFSQRGEGWVERTLDEAVDQYCSLSYGIVQPGDEMADGLPIVRPTDLGVKVIELNGLKRIDANLADSYRRTTLRGNDLLLCVRGTTGLLSISSKTLLGGNVTRGIVPIHFEPSLLSQEFGYYLMRSEPVQTQIRKKTYGTALMQINIRDLRKLVISIPSLQKQHELVAKFDALWKDTQRLESLYQRKIEALDELKQSLLQQAFSGQL